MGKRWTHVSSQLVEYTLYLEDDRVERPKREIISEAKLRKTVGGLGNMRKKVKEYIK